MIEIPLDLIRRRRKITGICAVLLPFNSAGEIHWSDFARLIEGTVQSGLTPAVNMDTGYVNLITKSQRHEVLKHTKTTIGGQPFYAGAFLADTPDSKFNIEEYAAEIDNIQSAGATPVVFQSYGLTNQSDDAVIQCYRRIAKRCDQFVAFELGEMFAPQGKINSRDVYRGLLEIKNCVGAKHSSLDRRLEWERLQMRNESRADFKVFTGNDLAIDMVMFGSDYLLGLSTMAPDYFARRDGYWLTGDSRFYELNDVLQYLGNLAFREPVPAYKKSGAMFLKMRGWIESDYAPSVNAARPNSDLELFQQILNRLEEFES